MVKARGDVCLAARLLGCSAAVRSFLSPRVGHWVGRSWLVLATTLSVFDSDMDMPSFTVFSVEWDDGPGADETVQGHPGQGWTGLDGGVRRGKSTLFCRNFVEPARTIPSRDPWTDEELRYRKACVMPPLVKSGFRSVSHT